MPNHHSGGMSRLYIKTLSEGSTKIGSRGAVQYNPLSEEIIKIPEDVFGFNKTGVF
jgi:hypothetical protein